MGEGSRGFVGGSWEEDEGALGSEVVGFALGFVAAMAVVRLEEVSGDGPCDAVETIGGCSRVRSSSADCWLEADILKIVVEYYYDCFGEGCSDDVMLFGDSRNKGCLQCKCSVMSFQRRNSAGTESTQSRRGKSRLQEIQGLRWTSRACSAHAPLISSTPTTCCEHDIVPVLPR